MVDYTIKKTSEGTYRAIDKMLEREVASMYCSFPFFLDNFKDVLKKDKTKVRVDVEIGLEGISQDESVLVDLVVDLHNHYVKKK